MINNATSTFRKTLVLTRCFPKDFDKSVHGIFQRLRLILESLCSISSQVVVVFFVENEVIEETNIKTFSQDLTVKWGIKVHPILHRTNKNGATTRLTEYILPALFTHKQSIFSPCGSKSHSAFLDDLIGNNTDLIFVHRLNSFYPILRIKRKLPPIVLDLDDIEHKKFYRDLFLTPFWLGKLAYYLQIPSVFFGEIRSIWRSSVTFVCSENDRKYIQHYSRKGTIQILPNSVTYPEKASARRKKEIVLFIGTYTYSPNIDAAENLINTIFPKIRKECPSAELWLVGNKIERLKSYGRNIPGVNFVGFVDSLDSIYKDASLVCCPIRSGGGTRIKIIEAAAYGLPVVSTSIGAEGLDFLDGEEIVIADDDQFFSTACVKLLQDYAHAGEIGLKARKRARKYSREGVISRLKKILKNATDN